MWFHLHEVQKQGENAKVVFGVRMMWLPWGIGKRTNQVIRCFPLGGSAKNTSSNVGDAGLIPKRRSHGEGNGPTPIFLPVKFHGHMSLAVYSPWCCMRVGYNLVTKQQQQQ